MSREVFRRSMLAACAAVSTLLSPAIHARVMAQAGTTAQSPPGSASFEVASIKVNKSGDGRVMLGIQPGGRFTGTNVTTRMLVRQAFRLQDSQLIGGAGWMDSEHYDILAKAETDVGPEQVQEMVRSLLVERFKLATHAEKREMPIYALVLAREDGKLGPNLKPATVDCAALRARGGPPPAPPAPGSNAPPLCGMRIGPGSLNGNGMPLSEFVRTVSNLAGRIVVDRTGLTGGYEYDLQWTPDAGGRGGRDGAPPTAAADGPSLFTALQEQLGLKLESTRGPVDVVVIDHIEQPTVD